MSTFEWLSNPTLRDPLAVLAFSGWGDAGDSSSEAARFLVEEFQAKTIGRFESDSFFDFQVNRPVVSLDEAGVRSISWPTTEVLSIESSPRDLVVVYVPEYIVRGWWRRVLHDTGTARLRERLMRIPGVMVTSVPWQLESSEPPND